MKKACDAGLHAHGEGEDHGHGDVAEVAEVAED